ncbi:putative RNA methyltransferase [Brevibacillus parabrevis]|uniref:putative RNA methyltransferase n=1 Tax=Brevibacillus parabrevis TaxID=54914 RepID=UPI001F61FD19|nr:methyltransferase domain-containing protein [Brevibacillus parabrevis]
MLPTKKERQAELLARHSGMLRCPVCHGALTLIHTASLVCANRHCFDVSRHGYVHLANAGYRSKYEQEMFLARRTICEQGFFSPLHAAVSQKLAEYAATSGEPLYVLDAGCGEGSHLARIREEVIARQSADVVGAGVDLSKAGIALAAKAHPELIWCVGDLANAPFADNRFAAILNVLSPSNTREFARMLIKDGFVIKVVPGERYLLELRERLYAQPVKQVYSNAATIQRFAASFSLIDCEQVAYSFRLDQPSLAALVQMTPLTWGGAPQQLAQAHELEGGEISVEFTVLVGRK